MINLDWILFISFILILAFLILRDRKNVKREGLMLIRRTKKGRDFIDKVEKKSPYFWNIFSIAGIAVAIPAVVLVTALIVFNAYTITSGEAVDAGVKLLLPGPVSAPLTGPAFFIVPWWIWIIGVFSVMIPHEFSHGIMCRLEKIKIKSVGWILFFIIPGAFVEPDESRLKKSKASTKLKVYAAGSFANIVVASLTILIFAAFSFSMLEPVQQNSIYFTTVENTPANLTGMLGYPTESITEIDNHVIKNSDEISAILAEHNPGDTIEIKTTGNTILPYMQLSGRNLVEVIAPKTAVIPVSGQSKTYTLILAEHPEEEGKAYIGIQTVELPVFSSRIDTEIYLFFSTLFIWIFIFNLGIGLINLLPVKPLDGGFIFAVIAEKFSKRNAVIVKTVAAIVIAFLIFNIIGPYLV